MFNGVLFGFGNMGEDVVRRLKERSDVKLNGVMDPNPERRAVAIDKYGLKAVATADEALNLGRNDFALVTSPNAFHCEQTLKAIQAGAHIFCEKPLALSIDHCDQMVAAVESAKRINVVNFGTRFSGLGRVFKRLIDQGVLGEIQSAWRFRSRGYGLYAGGARHPAVVHPEHSGGWTIHHMCHDIDMVYWLVGPFEKVWSLQRTTAPKANSEEYIWTMAELARAGQKTKPIAMLGDAVHRQRFEEGGVAGSAGTLTEQRRDDKIVVVLQPEGGEPGLRSGSGPGLPPQVFSTENEGEPGGGLGHFFDCLANGKPSQVTFRDAREAVKVALACQQSAREGGAPVPVKK